MKEIPTKLGYVSNCYRYCKNCFVHIIEKRVRKHVRTHHALQPKQRIVANNGVSHYFLEYVLHCPLTILKSKKKRNDIVISSDTIDDACVVFLEKLFGIKQHKQTKQLGIFLCITDEELGLYCQHKKMPFVPKTHPLKARLHVLEQHHPGTLHALAKSIRNFHGVM